MPKIPGIGDTAGSLAGRAGTAIGGQAQAEKRARANSLLPGLGDALTSKTGIGDFLVGKGLDSLSELFGGAKMGARATGLLADMNSRPDPLWQRDWSVEMPMLQSWKKVRVQPYYKGNSKNGTIQEETRNMTLPSHFVEEIQMPMIAIETDGVFQQGTRKYFPQHSDIGSVSINFYVDQEMQTINYLEFWRSLVQSPNGDYNYPDDFKFPIKIHVSGSDGSALGKWTLLGCWPSRPNNFSFTGTSDRHIHTVEFSVDGLVFESNVTPSSAQSLTDKFMSGIKTGIGVGF